MQISGRMIVFTGINIGMFFDGKRCLPFCFFEGVGI